MTAPHASPPVAVVTGGATGIGLSMARAFLRRSYRVVLADIDVDAARQSASELSKSGYAVAETVNVADPNSVDTLADRVFDKLGRVDILCNNAGVSMRPFRAVWDASYADFRWLMDVNYFGVVNGLTSFVPRMRAQTGHRHVVNTASFTALDVSPGHAAYAASKAAIVALSDSLRVELAQEDTDFGVSVLYAGAVHTNLLASERLRPPDERSARRDVREYQSSLPRPFHYEPVSAEDVGEQVAHGVELGLSAILTHRYPDEEVEARLAPLRMGHLPPGPVR